MLPETIAYIIILTIFGIGFVALLYFARQDAKADNERKVIRAAKKANDIEARLDKLDPHTPEYKDLLKKWQKG